MTELEKTARERAARGDASPPESFCMAPWVAVHLSTLGDLKPCCEYAGSLGKASETSLSDYWNGRPLADLRKRLARGEDDPGCWKCAERSRAGAGNLRDEMNRRFSRHVGRVEQGPDDSGAPVAAPVQWDLRFSNLCNLRCRTCWHGASSRWYVDTVRLPGEWTAGPTALLRGVEDPEPLLRFMMEHADGLEEIYFAGGEPLIMQEHYRLLLELDRRGLHDVALRYSTNLTETVFQGVDVFDVWSRFRQVKVVASVDGVGPLGELIRKDLSWERLLENRRRMKEICPDVEFGVNTVVSVLNLFHVAELQRRLQELDFVALDRHELSMAQEPPRYSIQILPRRMKRRAERILREHIRWLQQQGDPERFQTNIDQFAAAIAFMKAAHRPQELPMFAEVTAQLDALREEKLTAVAPELAPLMRYQAAWPGVDAARSIRAWGQQGLRRLRIRVQGRS
jgi:MoaA/NifB/PqqE/SkfB family radical SAM enzyme